MPYRDYHDNDGTLVLRTLTSGASVWSPHDCSDATGHLVGSVRWKDCKINGLVVARNRHRGGCTTLCSPMGDVLASCHAEEAAGMASEADLGVGHPAWLR